MSASQLVFGTPAKLAVVPYAGIVTLANVAGVAQFTFVCPFPVGASTVCFITPLGAAPAGTLFVTRTFGATGVGTITVASTNVADVGDLVQVQVFNATAEGF
jgi:hypothetical protein